MLADACISNRTKAKSSGMSVPTLAAVATLFIFALSIFWLSVFTNQAHAQEDVDWWFDVEVVAFKRTGANESEERFSRDIAGHTSNSEAESSQIYSAVDLISLPLFQTANPHYHLSKMAFQCSSNILTFAQLPSSVLTPDEYLEVIFQQRLIQDDQKQAPREFESVSFQGSQQRLSLLLSDQYCIDSDKTRLAKNTFVDNYLIINSVEQVPVYLAPESVVTNVSPHLLDAKEMHLADMAQRLFGQRNIKALAHIAWRQPVVFGEDDAPFFRVYAGKKLKLQPEKNKSFEELSTLYATGALSEQKTDQDNFFNELKVQLDNNEDITWADKAVQTEQESSVIVSGEPWELDGQFKVYLKYINRVPYLHIEADFLYQELVLSSTGEPVIELYPFKQRRRIISKQIHYFDHPKIGFMVRLVRYEKPKENEEIN